MLGLAQIWALCDIAKTGKLNQEQYALALHLIDLHKVSDLWNSRDISVSISRDTFGSLV